MSELLRATIALQEDSIQMLERKIERQADRIDVQDKRIAELEAVLMAARYFCAFVRTPGFVGNSHIRGLHKAIAVYDEVAKPPEDNQDD